MCKLKIKIRDAYLVQWKIAAWDVCILHQSTWAAGPALPISASCWCVPERAAGDSPDMCVLLTHVEGLD